MHLGLWSPAHQLKAKKKQEMNNVNVTSADKLLLTLTDKPVLYSTVPRDRVTSSEEKSSQIQDQIQDLRPPS